MRLSADVFDGALDNRLPDELRYGEMIDGNSGVAGYHRVHDDGRTAVIIDRRIVTNRCPEIAAITQGRHDIPTRNLANHIEDVVLHEQLHHIVHLAGRPPEQQEHTPGTAFATLAAWVNGKLGLPAPRPEHLPSWPHLCRNPYRYIPEEIVRRSITTMATPTPANDTTSDNVDRLARGLVAKARKGFDAGFESFDRTDVETYAAKIGDKMGPQATQQIAARLAVTLAAVTEGLAQLGDTDTANTAIDEAFGAAAGDTDQSTAA